MLDSGAGFDAALGAERNMTSYDRSVKVISTVLNIDQRYQGHLRMQPRSVVHSRVTKQCMCADSGMSRQFGMLCAAGSKLHI